MKRCISSTVMVVLPVCLLLSMGCEATAPEESPSPVGEVYPPYPWPVSSVTASGLDSVRIDSALTLVRAQSFLYSFLVAHRDSLVVEYYRPPLTQYNDYELRSATKSIVSVLVGAALEEGLLSGLDVPFLGLFPEYREPGMDPRKDSITIRHLLTMRGGFDHTDGGTNSDVLAASPDWIRAYLGLPLLFSPGERFSYSSLQTHMLSAVISRVSGMTTLAYLDRKIFGPLKISVRHWDTDPLGYHSGGTGMFLTARDMLRFGHLILRRGTVPGASVVSGSWIDSSFVPRNLQDVSWGDFGELNYGYQWWMNREPQEQVWFAAGYGGQFILIDPARDLVIVTTAEPPDDPSRASMQEIVILQIIARHVLPAAL